MCENFRQFIGVLFLIIVVIPIVVCVWFPYVYNLGERVNKEVKREPSYISSHHCVAENSIVIDGITRTGYLFNAESENECTATDESNSI